MELARDGCEVVAIGRAGMARAWRRPPRSTPTANCRGPCRRNGLDEAPSAPFGSYGLSSYGLCSYGLSSYGLYSSGLYCYGVSSDGLYRYDLCSYGLCSYGLYSNGVYSHGRRLAAAVSMPNVRTVDDAAKLRFCSLI